MHMIKTGRKEIETKPGDYIQRSNQCWIFVTGDNRNLEPKSRVRVDFVRLSKAALKRIDFSRLRHEESDFYERWYF